MSCFLSLAVFFLGSNPSCSLGGESTLAGNFTLLGAASTLIIMEEAEKQGQTLGFFDFLRIGIVVTAVTIGVLYFYLLLVS